MNVKSVLKGFSEITYVPVTCFQSFENRRRILYFFPDPGVSLTEKLADRFPENLFQNGKNADIMIFENLLTYGYIHLSETETAVFGPVIELPIDQHMAQYILLKSGLPMTEIQSLIAYHENTAHYSIYKFASILSFINSIVNDDENISARDLLPEEYTGPIREKETLMPVIPDDIFAHKSEKYETELYSLIYSGQYAKMKKFLQKAVYEGDIGNISSSEMRRKKYLIVASITMAARAAVTGGVSYETAMNQADFYIRKTDEADSTRELYEIHKNMLLHFTQMVSDHKLGKPASSIYYRVQNYIVSNLTEKITTEKIADELGLNRSYLSSQFKKETGMNLVDYISILKVDEAKRLLLTTDYSFVHISNTLCFSSQSYFQSVFKKYTGSTPKEFRSRGLHSLRSEKETNSGENNTDIPEK